MSNLYCKSVNEWVSGQDIEEGYSIANAKYLRDYSYHKESEVEE